MVEKFATGVSDNGGKFATGVVDTGGNFALVSLTTVAILPPVSLIPVVHRDSANFRKNPKRSKWKTLGLGGKLIHEKNQKQKIS